MSKISAFGWAVGVGFFSYLLGVLIPHIGEVPSCTSTPLSAWTVCQFSLILVVMFMAGKASEIK